MPAPYSAGSVFMQVVPSFEGVQDEIKAHAERYGKAFGDKFDESFAKSTKEGLGKSVDEAMKGAEAGTARAGSRAGKKYADGFAREASAKTGKELVRALDRTADDAGRSGGKAGEKYAGKFVDTLKQQVSQMSKQIGAVRIDVDEDPALRGLDRIKAAAEQLSKAKIGVDLDPAEAAKTVHDMERLLDVMSKEAVSIRTRVDLDQAARDAGVVRKMIETVLGSEVGVPVNIEPERLVGNFERTFRKSIEAALNNLPPLELNVDDASVSAEVDRIRRELATLRDARLGIDLSSDDALARLRTLMGELQRLDGKTADVRVRSDVGTTYKELRAVFGLVEALEHKNAKVDVSAPGAASAAAGLRAVNREAAKTNVNGMDAANAFRAFNGRIFAFVALAPAAIPLLAGIAGGLAAIGPAAIAGIAGIGVAAMGFSGIKDAVQGLTDVEQNAVKDSASRARTMRGAARGVRDAEQALSRARQDAADSTADAGRRVEDALRSQQAAQERLTDAQTAAARAERDLVNARDEAQNQLEDIALRARGGALAERAAALALAQAQAAYISTFADGSSTNVEREQAAIALEREKLGYDEAVIANQRLAEQKAEADRTGIEGTQAYQDALGKVASASSDVESAQDGVADAQRGVADAQREAARASRDASQSIADATQNLTDAQADYQDALVQTDDVGTSSMRRLEQAMAKLGPAGQSFAKFLHGLTPYWAELRRTAQEGFLPGLQGWMQTITGHYGPALQRTIGNLSGAMGDVFSQFGEALMTKPFADLFHMIEVDGPRFIKILGAIFTNFGSGFASLMTAFVPFTDLVLGWFRDISAEFARWAGSLAGSSGLQSFFDYVKRIGPEIGDFLLALGDAIVNLGIALAPYGEVVLNILTGFLGFIGDMDPAALGAIAVGILGIAVAMQTIFGLTSLVKSAEAAWHLATGTLDGFAGKVPLMAGGLITLAVGLAVLYANSEDFRALVDTIVGAIADFVGWIKDSVGPIGLMVTALAGFVVAKTAATWIGGLLGPTSKLGTATDFLGDSYGKTTSKIGMFGKVLGAVGLAIAAWQILSRDSEGQIKTWTQAVLDGGTAADQLRQKVAAAKGEEGSVGTFLKRTFLLSDIWDNSDPSNVASDFADATKAAKEAYDAMGPLEKAQQDVTTATNDLAFAQDKYGTTSSEARNASNNLIEAQQRLETKQHDLKAATDDTTTALLEQANAVLGAANSDIAFSNAQVAANRAAEAYKKVMADSAASVDDRTEAENNLKSSFLSVAGAALRQAQDQAKLRGETLTATDQAGIQLKAMHDLAEAMGIELPESIGSLITGFEDTAGKAVAAAGAVDGVTGAIQVMPGGKQVILEALDQPAIDTLTALGIRVEEQPDGTVALWADDDPAQQVLDAFVAEGNTRQITVGITGSWLGSFMEGVISGKPPPGAVVVTPGSGRNQIPGLPPIPGTGGKAAGGPIVGPGTGTSDEVPILASNGEYMVKASSVSKYGLAFMDLINAGRFAEGGLIGGRVSIPRWSTPTDINAIDVSPLAAMWGEAIDSIGTISGDAAPLLASMWAALTESAQKSVIDLRGGATAEWTGLTDTIAAQTEESLGATEQRFRDMDATVGRVVGGTRDTLRTVWGDLRNVTADPVNFVISNVLNGGLFAALNSVASTFGLDKTIPPAQNVVVPRFATGGRVPGYSPNKDSDNILAKLTAGEFVQPVDSVQYYGSTFMEALRKRQIPKDALPGFATGGPVGGTWQQLNAIRAQLFPGSVMTSGYRPGARDHHGAGNAIDIGVAGNRPSQLAPIARRIAQLFPASLELINNPGGSIKNGSPVPPSFWGPATWAAHAGHVHWAATAAQIAAGVLGASSVGEIPNTLVGSIMQPIADMFSQFGTNAFTQQLADVPNALATGVWASLASADQGNAAEATLYDQGGYLPPGLSMVMNGTGKPEPVLTAAELDLLRNGGGHADDRSLIGALTLPVMNGPSVEEIAGEIMHVVTVASRGGAFDD